MTVFCSIFVIQFECQFFVCSSVYFDCSEMFSLFLLIGKFDLIKIFGTHMGAHKVWGPCLAKHVRSFLNPALVPSYTGW